MSNVFEDVAMKVKNSKIVIWVFFAAMAMLLIGLNHFVEDSLSSYYGIQMLEVEFGVQPVTYDLTYVTMSIAPQVAQIVFAYMYVSNTRKNKWAGIAALMALSVDFFSDTWYRSDANLFDHPGTFLTSIALTLAYFTVCSELFITMGLGIALELVAPVIVQLKRISADINRALGKDEELPIYKLNEGDRNHINLPTGIKTLMRE